MNDSVPSSWQTDLLRLLAARQEYLRLETCPPKLDHEQQLDWSLDFALIRDLYHDIMADLERRYARDIDAFVPHLYD